MFAARHTTALRLTALLALTTAATAVVGSSGATFNGASASPTNRVTAAADWTGPVVSLTDPGSPLRGTVTVTATATDAIGSVASVRFQRSPAGAGQWADLCTDTTAPFTCAWNTASGADGGHDLRAIATDNAGNATTSAVVAGRVVDNTAPVVALQDPGAYLRDTVTLTATASDARTGVASVVIQRSLADAGSWTTICTVTAAPYSCPLATRTLADNDYDLRAVATDGAGNMAMELLSAVVDNTAPTTSLSVAGSPLRGVTTFTATPADAGAGASGVSDVTVQVSPAGAGSWATACTTSTTSWSCPWDTTAVATGSYDFRAVVTDLAGNAAVSSTTTRTVDNSVSSVFMNDPGAFLRGTATLQATVSNPVGSASLRIQIATSGSGTWTTLCTVTAAPWSCPFDSTTRADGPYDLRAVLTDASGTKTSNTVTSRIDNTLLRGLDVLPGNAGIAGRVEAGDSLRLTYSDVVLPSSLATGWDGTAPLAVTIRLRDGGLVGLNSKADVVDVLTDSTLKTAVRIGSVNLKGDFVKGGKTVLFNGTLTLAGGTTATLTVGTMLSGTGLRTSTDRALTVWTPSAGATGVSGNPSSTAPVTQAGTAKVNL